MSHKRSQHKLIERQNNKYSLSNGYTQATKILHNQSADNVIAGYMQSRSGGKGTWISGRNWTVNIREKVNGKNKIVATIPNYFNEGDEDLTTGALLSVRNLDNECLTRNDLAKSGINFSPVISEGRSIARKDYELFHADTGTIKPAV